MTFPGISGAPLLIKPPSGMKVQDFFNTSLWTGTGAARTITTGINSGEGSMVWIKGRSASTDNLLVDTIRGAGNYLVSNSTAASVSNAQSVSAFGPSGYSLGNLSSVNGSSQTYVGWQFRRAEKFFDIVQYIGNSTNRAVPHSLDVAPGLVVVKSVSSSANPRVQHRSVGGSKVAFMNLTLSFDTDPTWNNTPADSSYVYLNAGTINNTGETYIAYIFAHDPSPEGFIQCGSYVGNGSATGPVVNLGWRPQYLMIKNSTAAGDWQIIDAQRGFTATDDAILLANTSGAETSSNLVNQSSTGFQIASAASNVNTNGQTYIYMAIREA